jgi:hypothetical protein
MAEVRGYGREPGKNELRPIRIINYRHGALSPLNMMVASRSSSPARMCQMIHGHCSC